MLQKRIATMQDISCLGKCSLTAAISIISSFGMEAVALPTAMLSSHTGAGFEGYTFRELSDDMPGIIKHWQKLSLSFDAMYSGYLGSIRQTEIAKEFFDAFRTDKSIVLVDPVMGDEGRLYDGFDMDFVRSMYSLCSHADIICPNVTEACLLTGIEYKENHDYEYVRTLSRALLDTGAGTVIVTGLSTDDSFGAMCTDSKTKKETMYCRKKIPGTYYGTGDIFASVLCCAVTKGFCIEKALKTAIDFVYESILATQDELCKYHYGVKFEQKLGMLTSL